MVCCNIRVANNKVMLESNNIVVHGEEELVTGQQVCHGGCAFRASSFMSCQGIIRARKTYSSGRKQLAHTWKRLYS